MLLCTIMYASSALSGVSCESARADIAGSTSSVVYSVNRCYLNMLLCQCLSGGAK